MKTSFLTLLLSVLSCTQSPPPSNTSEDGNGSTSESSFNTDTVPSKKSAHKPAEPQTAEVKIWLTAELPKCDSDRDGLIYYVMLDSVFKYCSQGGWRLVDLRGPKGESGATGPTGIAGSPGHPGSPGSQGAQGVAGTQGSQGPTGPAGEAGFNSLVRVVHESPGPNCSRGGLAIKAGLDNGSGGVARDGELQDAEVNSTNYVCNPDTGTLQVYDSTAVAKYQLIDVLHFSDVNTDSIAYGGRMESLGLLVKSLGNNSYTLYQLAGAHYWNSKSYPLTNPAGLSRVNVSSEVYYTSTDCTGQGYLRYWQLASFPQWTTTLMLKFTNFSLAYFDSYEVTASTPFREQSAGTNFASKGVPSSCVRESSSESVGIPVVVRSSTFASSIGAGWYISP
ncbi:MAG: collagen-like protein [Deltaproteobacteria bacterium]|nr:collagen-like protein [Deltaproteobacteria bacterium]